MREDDVLFYDQFLCSWTFFPKKAQLRKCTGVIFALGWNVGLSACSKYSDELWLSVCLTRYDESNRPECGWKILLMGKQERESRIGFVAKPWDCCCTIDLLFI